MNIGFHDDPKLLDKSRFGALDNNTELSINDIGFTAPRKLLVPFTSNLNKFPETPIKTESETNKFLPNDTSFETNRREFIETSDVINTRELNDASPPTNRRVFIETSP